MIYKNALITTIDEQFLGYLEVDHKGKIVQITRGITFLDGYDCKQQILMPSFIDSHTHGGYGFSFNDILTKGAVQKLQTYQSHLPQEGVGFVVASTVTDTWSNIKKFSQKYQALFLQNNFLLTLYLEGPFISKEKKGAHPEDKIIPLNDKKLEFLKKLFSNKKLIIAVAPEMWENKKYIAKYAKNFIFSLGHSNAYDLSKNNFFNKNIKRITHLFNATSMFNHRQESIVNTALQNSKYLSNFAIELLGDGKHIEPKVLKLAYEILPKENIVIVSDSLPQKGLNDGFYKLGFLDTVKQGDLFYLKDYNTLAGSGMAYNKILAAFHKATKASWSEMVRFSSYNAAKNLGMHHQLGIIKENSAANFVLIDKNFNVKLLVKNGESLFKKS